MFLKRQMRLLLWLVLFSPVLGLAQEWRLPVTSKVEKDGTVCEGAVVTLFKNGKQVDQKITGPDGRFRFELEPNGDYRLEVTKPGCIKKKFMFNTKGVPPEEAGDGFKGFDIRAIEIFEPTEDCESLISQLEKPLMKVAYDPNTKNFELDQAYSDLMLDLLADIGKCADESRKKGKIFVKLMQEGNNMMGKKDCKSALGKYNEALAIRPKSEEALGKKKEAEECLAGADKLQKDYNDAMAAGNAALGAKEFDKAIESFTAASKLKPSEPEPPKKIEEAKRLKKEAEGDAEFNKAMQEAAAAFTAKDYNKAIEQYERAKLLKASHPEPPKKIAEIKALLEGQSKYENAMKRGNEQMNSKNWDAAITAFNEALTHRKDDAEAKKKIEECNAEKQKALAAADLQKKYDQAMKDGNTALAAKKFDDAIAQFTSALDVKKGDAPATAKLEEAKTAKKQAEEAAKTETAYAAAMQNGNNALSNKKWQEAISAFTEALNIKKNDQPATQKLAEANAGLDAWKKEQGLQAQYDEAMKRGNDAFGNKKWDDAIAAYTDALKVKKDDPVAAQKITDARKAKEDAAAAARLAEEQKKYDDAITQGDNSLAAQKWDDAVTAYKEALNLKPADAVATKKIEDVEAARKAAEDKAKLAELQKKYDEAMKRGNEALAGRKWDNAISAYTEALTFKAEDPSAKQKLDEAKKGKELEEQGKKADELYAAAMKRGAENMTAQKFTDAIASFNEALGHKKGDAEATKKLAEATAAADKANKEAEAKKKYDEAMARGNAAMGESKWADAVTAFGDALAVKKDDAEAKTKKLEAETNLKKFQSEADRKKKYGEAMAKGKTALDGSKWQDAITAFREALTYEKDDAEATAKLKEAEDKLKLDAAGKSYDAAMKEGEAAMTGAKYQSAVDAYKKALTFKEGDANATAKLKEAEDKLKEEIAKAGVKKQYDAAMASGNNAMKSLKYADAISSYKEALNLIPEDAAAKEKLAAAEEALKKQVEKEGAEKEYQAAMQKGNDALAGKQYQAAIDAYNNALTYKPADVTATKKKTEAEAALKLLNDTEKNFENLLAQAREAFDKKEWQKALDDYLKAQKIKSDHPEPNTKIPVCQEKLLEEKLANEARQKIDADYKKFMAEGAALYAKKEYQEALKKYISASDLKREEQEPKIKIKEIEDLISKNKDAAAQAQKLEEDFQTALKEGDAAVAGKEYEKALEKFNFAKTLKPAAPEPPKKIADVTKLIEADKKARLIEEEYEKAMKEGNDAEIAMNWTAAIKAYRDKALKVKPGDAEATRKWKEAEKALKDRAFADSVAQAEKNLLDRFNKLLNDARAAYTAKDYKSSLASYTEAHNLKKDEPEPPVKIDELKKLIKQQEEEDAIKLSQEKLDKEYQKAMDEGSKAVLDKKYELALDKFRHAQNLKPTEKDPPQKISEVEELLRKLKEIELANAAAKENERKYQEAMKNGETGVTKKDWQGAKKQFEEALKYRKDDPAALQRISFINDRLKEIEEKEREIKYKAAMTRGANDEKLKKYPEAVAAYEDALKYKPKDPEATKKLEELKKLVKPEIASNNNTTVQVKEDKWAKYPQGITTETVSSPGCVTYRSVVKKGEDVKIYEKKHYSWGGTSYFLDGKEISGSAYQAEIK